MKVDLSPYEKAVNILNGLTPRQDRIITEALDDLISQRDTARSEVARLTAEVEAMRDAIDEVCSWKHTDVTVLLSNPPQNAALVNAQRVLGDALRARKVGG